jgi:small-conductance mechanosensitive channel
MRPLRAAFLLACCVLTLFAATGPLFADDANEWTLVLDALRRQDKMIHDRLDAFKVRHAREALERARKVDRLVHEQARLALWQATASDPWEIRNVLAGFGHLQFEVERLSQRPQQTWASLEQNVAMLDTFRDRLAEIARGHLPERFREDILPSRNSLDALSADVTAIRDALAAETGPLRDLSAQIKSAEKTLQAALAPAWKAYYTQAFPTPLTPFFLSYLSQSMEDWGLWTGLCLELLQMRDNQLALLRGGITGAVCALLIFAAALAVNWLAARRNLPPTFRATIRKAALCLAAGAFFIVLSRSAPFFLFTGLSSVGEIMLTAALVYLSRLRLVQGNNATLPPVLWPTWRIFSLGLLLEAARVPEPLMSPVFAAFLCLSAWVFHKCRRDIPAQLRLERGVTRALTYVLPALACLSLYGMPQTAILMASSLFYIALALRFASHTSHFFRRHEPQHHPGMGAALLGVAARAGFPFFFLSYLFLFLWLLSTQYGGEDIFLELLSTETQVESVGISLKKLATLLAGFYAARALLALSAVCIINATGSNRATERVAKASLLTINTYVWWGIYAIFTMSVLGVSLTSIAVVAGGLSVGIGFGMQTMVNNFISGLILLFGRSVQAGDTIQLGETWGVVKEVNIRNTEVLTHENATVFVPNSELISGKIVNWSHRDPSVRRDICVGVAYGSDTALVREKLLAAAAACPAVLGNPPPRVLHWDFGASTLDFRLRVWLADVAGATLAVCTIREIIDRLFREAGIEIAFPQTDLHLRSAPVLEDFLKTQQEENRVCRQGLSALTERVSDLERRTGGDEASPAADSKDVPHGT